MKELLVAWLALAALIVGVAYLTSSPWLLGKRPDGKLRTLNVLILLPYFVLVWGRWWLRLALTSQPAWNEATPGLFLGRWPANDALPESVALVVDLTAEFPRAPGIGAAREYLCLPTLDLASPPATALLSVACRVAESPAPVFVHCAFGHGRSAQLVAAVLLRRGVVRSIPEALSLLAAARAGVHLTRSQRSALEQVAAQLAASA